MSYEENRVRYRLSVNPAVSERIEAMSKIMGLHPQQMAYMAMGLGLRMLEQLVNAVDTAASNPSFGEAIKSMQAANNAEAGDIYSEAMKQK